MYKRKVVYLSHKFAFFFFSSQVLGIEPRPHECWASPLLLSYILSPYFTILEVQEHSTGICSALVRALFSMSHGRWHSVGIHVKGSYNMVI
jgi:hypothetical protein